MTLRKCSEFKTQTVGMYGEGDREERQKIRLEVIKKCLTLIQVFLFLYLAEVKCLSF